ncbi:hypothetical protein POSPLADRAFT_1152113, partial [Postia placenta MAD-698-R-SB12]
RLRASLCNGGSLEQDASSIDVSRHRRNLLCESREQNLVELRSPVYGLCYLKHPHSLRQWANYSAQHSQAHIDMQRELLQTIGLLASFKNELLPVAQDDELPDNDFASTPNETVALHGTPVDRGLEICLWDLRGLCETRVGIVEFADVKRSN